MAEQRRKSRRQSTREESQFDERVLAIDRVARVVKGGRRFRFRALVVVGDKKGSLGVGSAKGADVTSAVAKANDVAKKHFIKAPKQKDTIPHEQLSKVAGAKVFLKPASAGTGLIAGGVVRVILEVAGYQNVLSKSLGSNNKTNVAYATIQALQAMQPRDQWHTVQQKAAQTKAKSAEKTIKKGK